MGNKSIYTRAVHAGDSLSVGVEDVNDIMADLTQALDMI